MSIAGPQTNKLLAYNTARKAIRASANLSFFALSFLAALSLGQLVIDPGNSLLLQGQLDPLFWLEVIMLPSIGLGVIYGLLTAPLDLFSHSVEATRGGIKYKEGLLWKRDTLVPYMAIDHVEMEQGPLQHALEFTEVKIDHGGWRPLRLAAMPLQEADKFFREVAKRATNLQEYATK